jgi:hypothetical protein
MEVMRKQEAKSHWVTVGSRQHSMMVFRKLYNQDFVQG